MTLARIALVTAITLCTASLLSHISMAQGPQRPRPLLPHRPAPQRPEELGLDRVFRNYQKVKKSPGEVARRVRQTGRLLIKTDAGSFDLELTPHDLRAENYRAEQTNAGGTRQPLANTPVRTFKGSVRGMKNAQARFTISDDYFDGVIITPGEKYFIEPLRKYSGAADETDFIFYKESDVSESLPTTCGVTLSEQVGDAAESYSKATTEALSATTATSLTATSFTSSLRTAELATEADFAYVSAAGGSDQARDQILSVLNKVDGIYEAQLGISLRVTYQHFWAEADPYTSTNDSEHLSQFRNYWNTNFANIPRDLAHMWTSKEGLSSYGLAYSSVVCKYKSFAYGQHSYHQLPKAYAVVAHELAHQFGASHAEGASDCATSIMAGSTGEDSQLTFCPYSLEQIKTYLASNSACLSTNPCQPPAGIVGWWPLDETSGTVARDVVNGNDGTLSGGVPTWGKVAGGWRFPNLYEKLTADGSGALNISGNQLTVEAWIKPENHSSTGGEQIAFIGKTGWPDKQAFTILLGAETLPQNQWQFEYVLTNSSGTRVHNSSTGAIVTVDGIYHHFAMTYDGANVRLYIDGILKHESAFSGNILSVPTEPFKIEANGSNSSVIPYSIDEVGVYNRPLTGDEVARIAGDGAAGKCRPLSTNLPPTAQNLTVVTDVNKTTPVTLSASDPDGDAVTYTVTTKPTHGTLSGTAPNLTYTPAAGYTGKDSFTYKASDSKADSLAATASITVRPPTADVSVTQSDTPGLVLVGGTVTYTVTVKNSGPVAATGTILHDIIPVKATFLSVTPSQGTCTSTDEVVCSIGPVASGATAQVKVAFRAAEAGVLVNNASVTASQFDSDTLNNNSSEGTVAYTKIENLNGNGNLAFTGEVNGNPEVFTMTAAGAGKTNLTMSPDEYEYYPSWSPDGKKLVYANYVDGAFQILVMNRDGSGQTRLTFTQRDNYYASWSPDGKKIAFTSYRDGDAEIYVMNADGSNQTRLTNTSGSDYFPTWSPDGRKILFTSYRDGDLDLYVMNPDGTDQANLTGGIPWSDYGCWSPDGTKIALSSYVGNYDQIFVMNVDGTGLTRLTNSQGDDFWPAWSPDGTKIAFMTSRNYLADISAGNYHYDIYVMNADGTGQTRLTTNTTYGEAPSWQPVVRYGTGTTVKSSANPSGPSQAVTFTATVTSAGGTPTGTVEFKDGTTSLGLKSLTAGTALLTTSTLSAGTHSITAVFKGSANFSGSTSPILSQKVTTYTISGVVKVGTTGLGGVTMTLSSPSPAGFAPITVTTAATGTIGSFSISNVPAGRTYTLKPSKIGYSFTPASISYSSLSANQTANFTAALASYSISGKVTKAGTTTVLPGVTLTITSPTPAGFAARTVQTNSLGVYTFTGLPAGRNYTITPTKTGCTSFTPTSRSFTDLSSNIPSGISTSFAGTCSP